MPSEPSPTVAASRPRWPVENGRGSKARTYDLRFWRPPLYQLSYTPVCLPYSRRTPVAGKAWGLYGAWADLASPSGIFFHSLFRQLPHIRSAALSLFIYRGFAKDTGSIETRSRSILEGATRFRRIATDLVKGFETNTTPIRPSIAWPSLAATPLARRTLRTLRVNRHGHRQHDKDGQKASVDDVYHVRSCPTPRPSAKEKAPRFPAGLSSGGEPRMTR